MANDRTGAAPLLATKLFVPMLRAELVARPRLRDLLEGVRGGRVTLVSAPAGSGKSTLLADWARHEEQQVAWVSLDEADDDPARLLRVLLAALRSCGAIGEEILFDDARAATRELREGVVTELLNAIVDHASPLALILDDYHVINSAEAHGVVQFVLDRLPPPLHLVIASRVDPPLALSRLRARNLLLELRAHDLRFDEREAAAFFAASSGVTLTQAQVAELERRTEGWAAGLQMAALSLRGRSGTEEFIRNFSGSNRFVLDYLTEEVLASQNDDVRTFVLQTSLLDRLNAPLCDAVTGRNDSAEVLRELDRANMFLIPLDDARFWYRYHHLFATVLQHQLERTSTAADIAQLHRRASEWYATSGMAEQALRHALLAGDVERAVQIVAAHALPRTLGGEPATVVRWIDALPRAFVDRDLELLLVQAVALIAENQLDRAGVVVSRIGELVSADASPFDRGRYHAVSGTLARTRDNADDAETELRQAITLLPEESFWAALASFNLGMRFLMNVDFARADEVLAPVRRQSSRPDLVMMAVLAQSYAAQCRLWLGRSAEAAALSLEALGWIEVVEAQVGEPVPFGAFPCSVLAELYTEAYDLERARTFALRALDYGRRGFAVALFEGARAMARAAAAQQDWDAAMDAVADARRAMATSSPAWRRSFEALFHRIVLRRALATGSRSDFESVAAWIASENIDLARWRSVLFPGFYTDFGLLAAARYWIERGTLDDARTLIDPVLAYARETRRTLSIIDILVVRAVCELRSSDEAAALKTVSEALALASGTGCILPFVEERSTIGPVVMRALAKRRDAELARKLAIALDVPQPAPRRSSSAVKEPLSDRELEVLRMLATGATNQEIGRKLFIAASTVKKHLENIYGKLGVRGRVEALAAARAAGLL